MSCFFISKMRKEKEIMPDVEVKINSMYPPGASGGIRAYASATVDGCLGIRGIKVVEGGRDGLFVSMPSRKTENGYKEICFPVTKEFREQLHKAVLDSYQQTVAMNQAPVQPQEAAPEQSRPSMQMGGM
jgi:stage V sporulation protein G